MYYTYVARQPILNVDRVTTGYELLFRDGECHAFPTHIAFDRATYRLIVEYFTRYGCNPNYNSSRCFVNFCHHGFINRLPLTLPKSFFFIEILETCDPDDDLYEAVRELYRSGYKLAADDFVFSPQWERFLPYLDIIKIDIAITGIDYACHFVTSKVIAGCKAKFLAECVATEQEFIASREAGFELFQGDFLHQPILIQDQEVNLQRQAIFELINEIFRNDININRLESLVGNQHDLLNIIYDFLKLSSTQRASLDSPLAPLREDNIKIPIALAIVSYLSETKPRELYNLSLQRARFCQLMADKAPCKYSSDQLFFTGLFSLLDALMGVPLEELELPKPVKQALTHREGELGNLLDFYMSLESADWNLLQTYCDDYSLTMHEVTKLFHIAQCWSQDLKHL
ncbi:EAL and HDOD domain-containing protein [Vibrio sp. WJH972]